MKNGLKDLVFLLLLASLVLSLPVQSASWWTVLVAFMLDTLLITSDVFVWIRKTLSTRSSKKGEYQLRMRSFVRSPQQFSHFQCLHHKGQSAEQTKQQSSN